MAASAERLLDHQIRAAEELDDKAEQMIRLAIATMAGAITVALFVGQEPAIDADPLAAIIFGVGLVANLLAAFLFVHAYVGVGRPVELYPSVSAQWLLEKKQDDTWTVEDHLSSLVTSYAAYAESNVKKMERSAGRRTRGLFCLLAGIMVESVAIALIVGRTIGV